ncbi:F-box domain protein [Aspergillus karnatakaensis]|uniref:F-box domain protein n=1 Tax=Aspergillus karnatakaensis TaxID=1810916 RepID=UPI003CCD9324
MTRLEDCPPEVVESIVEELEWADISSLRLTSRNLRFKATQHHVKSYFRTRRVQLIGQGLRKLEKVTRQGWLGCELRNLTLVGVVNNPMGYEKLLKGSALRHDPEKRKRVEQELETMKTRQQDHQQLVESGELARLLSLIFSNIAANGPLGKLQSLSLGMTVYREHLDREESTLFGGNWRLIWQAAAEMFRVIFAGIEGSAIQLDHLGIFNGENLQRCSLAANELSKMDYTSGGLSKTFSTLKSLSISVSDRIIDTSQITAASTGDQADEVTWSDTAIERDMGRAMAEAREEDNFSGLVKLIQSCHQLRKLHIHHYLVNYRRIAQINYPHERLLQRIADVQNLPPLEELILRGVYFREMDLVSILRRLPLRKLWLEFTHLISGSYTSIFDYCTGESSSVDSVYFDELRQEDNLVHFTGVGEPRFRTWKGAHGGNTLQREGEELKQPILYHLPSGQLYPCPSQERQQWMIAERREFGPPTVERYNLRRLS